MIEFTALAILCGLASKGFGNQSDRLARQLHDPSARIAFLLTAVLGIALLGAACLFFVLALVTAPWGLIR